MRRLGALIVAGAAALALAACGGASAPAPASGQASGALGSTLDQVIAAAKKEGKVSWAITPDFADGAPGIRDVVKAKYGVDLEVSADPQLSYPQKISKVLSENQAGVPATFDLIDISDSTLPPLLAAKGELPVDWAKYFPDLPSGALVRGTMLTASNQFLLPAYNPKVVPAAQAPTSYEDFADPKWAGKLSVIDTMSNWTWLAQPDLWGEQKLKDYIRKLAAQKPVRERYGGMLSRLVSGEYPISTGIVSGNIEVAQRKGQPIDVIKVTPIRNAAYGLAIPKNAQHANAALLVALANVTTEGQSVHDKFSATTAAWVPGTPAAKFIAENKTVSPD
jgi:iron(III) transport system substrate-binding protein